MALLGAEQIERIRRNHRGGAVSPSQLIDILQHRIAYGAERACRELVRRLAVHEYETRKAHTEGSRDQTLHYLVYIRGKGHHLRLDSRGVVWQITDELNHDLASVPPWVAPGAALHPRDRWA